MTTILEVRDLSLTEILDANEALDWHDALEAAAHEAARKAAEKGRR